jgi:DNA-binding IclR family transcriptional regulator
MVILDRNNRPGSDGVMAVQAAPSAQRAVEIVQFLSEQPSESFSAAELARRLDQSRATCNAVLLALSAAEWVRRDELGRYSIGTGLIQLGMAAQRGTGMMELLRAAADELYAATLQEATASIPSGRDFVIVARAGPEHVLGTLMTMGQVFPLVPPYGLAYAAWSDTDLEGWFDRAPDLGAAAKGRLRRAAKLVRGHGYAVILDPLTRDVLEQAADRLPRRRRAVASELLEQDQLVSIDIVGQPPYFSYISAPVFGADKSVVALFGLLVRSQKPTELPDLAAAVCAIAQRTTERINRAPQVHTNERTA